MEMKDSESLIISQHMKFRDSEEFVEDLDKGLGNGPLTLGIFCTKCNAQYELNKEAVALSMLTNTTFMEYLRWVQNSPCNQCNMRPDK